MKILTYELRRDVRPCFNFEARTLMINQEIRYKIESYCLNNIPSLWYIIVQNIKWKT